jgi:pantoate--beta-alanine ligase
VSALETTGSVDALRRRVSDWRRSGQTVALVPTMGNLHRGHGSLIDVAREHADRVVCSIYVNPTQFGPNEDYDRYPRTPDADLDALTRWDADLVYAPSNEVVYPFGQEESTWVEVPRLGDDLCGASRPGHFRGVTSVVCRFLNMARPDCAVFGEKDYQQLVIIRRMVADLSMPVDIVAAPTCRDEDGLALSSRNQYLSPDERTRAPLLYRQLQAVRDAIAAGAGDYAAVERRAAAELEEAGFRPDYVAVRDAETLSTPGQRSGPLVVLAAAWLGRARLIDNVRVESPT